MRITIANVCGMGRVVRRYGCRSKDNGLHRNLIRTKADIFILTETKLLDQDMRPEEYRNLRKWWGQHQDRVCIFQDTVQDDNKRRGVAILVKPGLNFTINHIIRSGRGRHIIVNITTMAHSYNIAAFYGFDGTSDVISEETLSNMYTDLQDMCNQHQGEVIIAGDFNFTICKEDSNTQAARKTGTVAKMLDIME